MKILKETLFDHWSEIDLTRPIGQEEQPTNREIMNAIVYMMKDGSEYTTFFKRNKIYAYIMHHIYYPEFGGDNIDRYAKWSSFLVNLAILIKWLFLLILGNALWDLIKYLFS